MGDVCRWGGCLSFLLARFSVVLFVWSITLNAPLEEPANPNLTMNPSKAPWYFLGLQEMLVYFDPCIAGVVMPSIIMIGLMVFPYVHSNPLGNGYYTYRQRRFAVNMFGWGFLMWILLIFIGTFIRGPGWIWFWPGETWDHNTVVFDRNRDLHEIMGLTLANFPGYPKLLPWIVGIFGLIVVSAFFIVGGLFFHNYCSGTGLMSGATFGRLAGRNAAQWAAQTRSGAHA